MIVNCCQLEQAACPCHCRLRRPRDVWHVDRCPTENTNVLSRDMVCQARETADHIGESGLIKTIAFIDTTTPGAGTAGIPRVYQGHGNSYPSCLVFDERSQLKERPAMQRGSLTLSNRYPSADALEVFQSDSTSSALSMFHDTLADRVVHTSGKTRFLLGSLIQSAFGRLGSLGLQLLAKPTVAIAHIVHLRRGVHLPIRIHSDVCHSHINSDHVGDVDGLGLFNLAARKQVELAVNQSEVGFSMPEAQEIVLPGATYEGYFLATAQTPNGDLSFRHPPIEDSVIVGDGSVLLEPASLPVIQFIAISHLADAANHYLSRQREIGSCLSIGKFLQLILAKGSFIISHLADSIAGSIRCFQSFAQQLRLSLVGQEFYLGSQFHAVIIPQTVNILKKGRRCRLTLSPECGSLLR